MASKNNAGGSRSTEAPVERRSGSEKEAGSPGYDKKLDGPNRPST